MKRILSILLMFGYLAPLWAQNNPVKRDLSCLDAGASDTYTCSIAADPLVYTTGEVYRFKANTANTGAASINFNSRGAITIKKTAGGITTDLADNDIQAGQWVTLVYDGTNMQMQSAVGNTPSTVSVVPASCHKGKQSTFTSNGTTQVVMFTCSVPARAAGDGVLLSFAWKHTTGSIASTVEVNFGSTSLAVLTGSTSGSILNAACRVSNDNASTTAQTLNCGYVAFGTSLTNPATPSTPAENWGSPVTLTVTSKLTSAGTSDFWTLYSADVSYLGAQ